MSDTRPDIGARLRDTWMRLSPNSRGVIWIVVGCVFFALNDMVVKMLGSSIHPVEIAFFRYLLGLILLSPIFIRIGWAGLRTERMALHFWRAVIAGAGQAAVYYAVVHLILADATALSFSRPMFMTLLAVIFLGEVVGWRRWTATVVGFAGVLLMLRPGQGALDPAALVALCSAGLFAIGLIIVRKLAATDSPNQILFYYHAFGIVLFAGPTVWLWKTPVGIEWVLVLLIGVLTCIAMFCFIWGFSIGEASLLGPIEYVRLVYAALIGFFVFAEIPDIWTWTGAAIIIASAVYIARREAGRTPPGEGNKA